MLYFDYFNMMILTLYINFLEAINCLKKCIQLYLESGRFGVAAKAEKEIGEIYEEEGDYENV